MRVCSKTSRGSKLAKVLTVIVLPPILKVISEKMVSVMMSPRQVCSEAWLPSTTVHHSEASQPA